MGLPTKPTVTTTTFTSITSTSAVAGGHITVSGGTITARGVVFCTSPNPTISGDKTIAGSKSLIFNSPVTGLIPNTQYYVRAYATNATGTGYANEITAKTLPISKPKGQVFGVGPSSPPTITGTTINRITLTTAVGGGGVTASGSSAITARGVVWGPTTTTGITVTGNSHTTLAGNVLGDFETLITGLTPDASYYLRSYATNSVGTAYGPETCFQTSTFFLTGNDYQLWASVGYVPNITPTDAEVADQLAYLEIKSILFEGI